MLIYDSCFNESLKAVSKIQEAEGSCYTYVVCPTYFVLIEVEGSDYEAVVVVVRGGSDGRLSGGAAWRDGGDGRVTADHSPL